MNIKLKIMATILSLGCLCSCGTAEVSEVKLNDWQKNLLEADGLPTDYDSLTMKQQQTITRIWDMISYLNDKYDEEFIYVDYIPAELNQSETLYAYPRATGLGDGKYLVTVKTKDGFTDDYSDFSVTDLAEELTNEFLTEHFGGDYKYFMSPLACDVKMDEMEEGKFQWKYGAENCIFLEEKLCSIDNLEKFAVEYARFLYEHELSGCHRIEVLKEFPEDEEIWAKEGVDLYGNQDRMSTGFYSLASNASGHAPTEYYTGYLKYDQDAEWYCAIEFDIVQTYTLEEFFSKYE